MQKLTTREPDPDMLEVAIASIEAIYDWRAFQESAGTVQKSEKQKRRSDHDISGVAKIWRIRADGGKNSGLLCRCMAFIQYVFRMNRLDYLMHLSGHADAGKEEQYRALIRKRQTHYPLQYITHEQNFMGLDFYVDENVPHTETGYRGAGGAYAEVCA